MPEPIRMSADDLVVLLLSSREHTSSEVDARRLLTEVRDNHSAEQAAEIDRLRAELDSYKDHLGSLERYTLPNLRREIQHHQDGKHRWRERAEKAEAERDSLKQRLHEAAMARVWTNEDGKKFVFADDIKGPLLGRDLSSQTGSARLDATAAAEAEATHWRRLGMTPPVSTEGGDR